jgi:2-polyprenyl-3-methyl-5-hydroxy-6-metoxy-1,4-benzoquinol methylase
VEQRNYAGITLAGSNAEHHLGGNAKEGDPFTFAPRAWSYVIERFGIRSVLDLGSGIGNAAAFFYRQGLQTLAVDGLAENVRTSIYPALRHDLTMSPVATQVDLVHCQEVVEHIEEKFLDNVIQSLACGRVILLTHAFPGEEDGFHHVNCRSADYWIKHVTDAGYNLLVEDTNRVRSIAGEERAAYLQRAALVFYRR